MNKQYAFLDALFNPDERTSFEETGKESQDVVEIALFNAESDSAQFFCINPLDVKDNNPNPDKMWHSTDKPRRDNLNIAAYRNFLIEFDGLPLEKQLDYINSVGMPWTTCTYSGGKSYHFIISLADDLRSEAEYKAIFKRLYYALDEQNDKACGNPSRLSRLAEAKRDNGKIQELVNVKGKVALSALNAWLSSRPQPPAEPEYIQSLYIPENGEKGRLSKRALAFIENGAGEGRRHGELVWTLIDLKSQGFPLQEALDLLTPILKRIGIYDRDKATIAAVYANKAYKTGFRPQHSHFIKKRF